MCKCCPTTTLKQKVRACNRRNCADNASQNKADDRSSHTRISCTYRIPVLILRYWLNRTGRELDRHPCYATAVHYYPPTYIQQPHRQRSRHPHRQPHGRSPYRNTCCSALAFCHRHSGSYCCCLASSHFLLHPGTTSVLLDMFQPSHWKIPTFDSGVFQSFSVRRTADQAPGSQRRGAAGASAVGQLAVLRAVPQPAEVDD